MTRKTIGKNHLKRICLLLVFLTAGAGALWAGGGRQAASSAETGKLSSRERTITVLITDPAPQPIKEWGLAQQAILEKTNIRIQFDIISGTSGSDRKNILLATNQLPEIAMSNIAEIKQYGASGIFLPLSKYVASMPNFKRYWDAIPSLRKGTVDGELYGFQMVARNETDFAYTPILRTDLIKKHNLQIPKTFDELLDVLEALKRIYPDSRPWAVRNGTKQLFATSAYMLGSGWDTPGYYYGTPLYYDKSVNGGTYIYGPATPQFKTVLKFFADAYRRGVLDPDYAISTADQFRARLTSGQSFFYQDNGSFSIDYTTLLQRTDPSGVLDPIPFLTNSYGQRRVISYGSELGDRFWVLRSDIKDPETVIKFMDWLYSSEGSDITNYGKEGVSFRYNAQGKAEFIPEYIQRFRDQPSVYYSAFSDAGVGKLNFAPHGGNTEQIFEIHKIMGTWAGANEKFWTFMAEEGRPGTGAFVQPMAAPPLSKAENDRAVELNMALSTYLDQEYDKYIMGKEPIDNWDRVIEQAVRLGARELEEIYNRANAAYK